MAVTMASAASTASRIISVSEMLPRLSAMVAGEIARMAAASTPAPGPASRRTAW
jgi:hypothetical protein